MLAVLAVGLCVRVWLPPQLGEGSVQEVGWLVLIKEEGSWLTWQKRKKLLISEPSNQEVAWEGSRDT
jgi:hypothetical protein